MSYQVLSKQSLSDAVFEQLRQRIVGGDMSPGDSLPSERILAELLGVNRGAVREGLKRLQQARLVQVRHGGATQVLDWQAEAGLDMLPALLLDPKGRVNVEAARGVMALRQSLAPTVAAAAARQKDKALVGHLDAMLLELEAAGSAAQRQRLSLEYWQALVASSGNIAFRLAFNSLLATYQPILGLLTQVMDVEFRDLAGLRGLNQALLAGDASRAEQRAAQHVALGTRAVDALLDVYQQQQGAS